MDNNDSTLVKKKSSNPLVWNILTILALVLIFCLAGYFLNIFINPKSQLNPFPPQPLPTPSSVFTALEYPTLTITPILPPSTWTPSPTLPPSPTRTEAPTWTPIPTNTLFIIGSRFTTFPTPLPSSTATKPVVSSIATQIIPPQGKTITPTAQASIGTVLPGRPATYTLMEGEYPYCIARRYNVDPNELLTLNGLKGGNFYTGLVLKIPQAGSFPGNRSLIPHPVTYTVLANDTIYSIACKYGDPDPLQIARLNGLEPPYTLLTGQSLNIP